MSNIGAYALAKARMEARFNENHGEDGRFTSGDGGGSGGAGSNDAKIKELEAELSKTSRFGSGAAKRKELQKQIDELKGNKEEAPKKTASVRPKQNEDQKDPVASSKNPVTPQKEEQFKIIQQNNAMTDDYHTGIRQPSDIKSAKEAFKTDVNDSDDFLYPDFTKDDAEKALSSGKITVYSSKPIDQGGFVSPSKMMAQDYAGGGKVYSKEVDVDSVAWIDSNEGQFADTKRSDDMNNTFETRAYSFDMSAETNDQNVGVITGRPIVYNSRTNIGLFDEIIEAGALNSANLKDVRFLVNHDTSKIPLARSRNNNANSTMQLIPDEQGLSIRVNLDIENNTEARNLYSAVKRGDVSGMSFMFNVPKGGDEWENLQSDHPLRRVKKVGGVLEVSAVTFPAYEATTINARSKEALDNARSALESARQQSAKSLESDLKLAKAKFEALLKM